MPKSFVALVVSSLVAAAPAVADVAEDLSRATVTGLFEQPVTLVDGVHAGEPLVEGSPARRSVVLVPYVHHRFDFDGDGSDETVAYLEESSGGTGHFLYLAVFEPTSDGLVSSALHRIGDREQIRSSTVEGRAVVLDLIAHGPRDPGCCPSQLQRRHFTMAENGEIEVRREILGEATTAILDGTAWRLASFDFRGEPVEVEVTLRFDQGRAFGNAGCNHFEARFESPARRDLAFGPVIRTKMMCPSDRIEVEERFLDSLAKASQWNFLAGRLAILVMDDDGPRSMMFVRE